MADPITAMIVSKMLSMLIEAAMTGAPNSPSRAPPSNSYKIPESISEIGESVIKCYHPSARFRTVEVVQKPWSRAAQYNAENSLLLSITWDGAFYKGYVTNIALIKRRDQLRAVVTDDSARIAYNRHCKLEHWIKFAE